MNQDPTQESPEAEKQNTAEAPQPEQVFEAKADFHAQKLADKAAEGTPRQGLDTIAAEKTDAAPESKEQQKEGIIDKYAEKRHSKLGEVDQWCSNKLKEGVGERGAKLIDDVSDLLPGVGGAKDMYRGGVMTHEAISNPNLSLGSKALEVAKGEALGLWGLTQLCLDISTFGADTVPIDVAKMIGKKALLKGGTKVGTRIKENALDPKLKTGAPEAARYVFAVGDWTEKQETTNPDFAKSLQQGLENFASGKSGGSTGNPVEQAVKEDVQRVGA